MSLAVITSFNVPYVNPSWDGWRFELLDGFVVEGSIVDWLIIFIKTNKDLRPWQPQQCREEQLT